MQYLPRYHLSDFSSIWSLTSTTIRSVNANIIFVITGYQRPIIYRHNSKTNWGRISSSQLCRWQHSRRQEQRMNEGMNDVIQSFVNVRRTNRFLKSEQTNWKRNKQFWVKCAQRGNAKTPNRKFTRERAQTPNDDCASLRATQRSLASHLPLTSFDDLRHAPTTTLCSIKLDLQANTHLPTLWVEVSLYLWLISSSTG